MKVLLPKLKSLISMCFVVLSLGVLLISLVESDSKLISKEEAFRITENTPEAREGA